MAYIITSDTVGIAIGPIAETASDLDEALNKARQMCETGFAKFQLKTEADTKLTATNCWTA